MQTPMVVSQTAFVLSWQNSWLLTTGTAPSWTIFDKALQCATSSYKSCKRWTLIPAHWPFNLSQQSFSYPLEQYAALTLFWDESSRTKKTGRRINHKWQCLSLWWLRKCLFLIYRLVYTQGYLPLLNDSDRKNCYEQVNIVFSLGHLCLKHRRYSRQGKYCVVDPGFKGIISPGWPGIIEGCPSRRWRKWR